jgi:hypothetical protein
VINAETTASLATAAGTLVLAIATFASVRSANRAARTAERSLLEGLRPLLVSSRTQDPSQKVSFADQHWVRVGGGQATVEIDNEVIYMTMALRNVGRGMAVLHGWSAQATATTADLATRPFRTDPKDYRTLTRDLYIPAGDFGFWQGALRDQTDPLFDEIAAAIANPRLITVELMYGDHEGGQRTLTLFSLIPHQPDDGDLVWLATVSRHRHLDGVEPR